MATVARATFKLRSKPAMRLSVALASFLVQLQADGRSPHTVAQHAR